MFLTSDSCINNLTFHNLSMTLLWPDFHDLTRTIFLKAPWAETPLGWAPRAPCPWHEPRHIRQNFRHISNFITWYSPPWTTWLSYKIWKQHLTHFIWSDVQLVLSASDYLSWVPNLHKKSTRVKTLLYIVYIMILFW